MSDVHKITVVGTDFVDMAMAVLLAQHNDGIALDIDAARVELISQCKAILDSQEAYRDAEFIVIATPTDYDPETNYFDTSSVEVVIGDVLAQTQTAMIIIKPTVPIGFTGSIKNKFSPTRLSSCLSSCARGEHFMTICTRRTKPKIEPAIPSQTHRALGGHSRSSGGANRR